MRSSPSCRDRSVAGTMKTLCALLLLCAFFAGALFGCGAGQTAHDPQPVSDADTPAPTAPISEETAPSGTPISVPTPTSAPTDAPTDAPAAEEDPQITEGSTFEIWFLDVGQGDGACILCNGHAMLIDGGDRGSSQLLYSFLKTHGIERLDCIAATHSDADHIGGLSGALQYASADRVYSTVTESDTKTFANFKKQLEKYGASVTIPDAGERFMLGSASVTILYPEAGAIISDNTSLVIRICYGATAFLFMGDCETEDEAILLESGADLSCDVLKVAHHGSGNSTSRQFLDRADPSFAVISVGKDNGYGHPTEQVLDALKASGAVLYRTDLHGTIHCVSDGARVTFDVAKNDGADPYFLPETVELTTPEESAPPEAPERTMPTEEPVARITYVVNKNTRKFHKPSCSSVKDILEKNRWDYTGTREELIAQGYVPCKRCNP